MLKNVITFLSLLLVCGFAQAGDYRLGVGDTVRIVVYDNQDLTTEDRVTESGSISFPLLGEVTVGGLTKGEAESLITDLLNRGEFIRNPQVNMRILQYREPKVSVLGQVNQPGRYQVEPFKTVLDALAEAGGLNSSADGRVVVLRREGEKTVQFKLDLHSIIDEGDLSGLLVIEAGDIVNASKVDQFYVYGAVQRPGVFRLERNMTVIQALSVAGGLTMRGTDRGLVIKRFDNANGATAEIPVIMVDTLKANDILVIKESLF